MPGKKKLFIKTYGCQMNVYDSERMSGALAATHEPVETPEEADLILLNTCHIREKAAEKVYSELGRMKGLKEDNPALKIGVTGCVAQAEGSQIIARQPAVDLVVGPQSYHNLPSLLEQGNNAVETEFPHEDKFDHLPPARRQGLSAFLTVQEGCDKFCTFCVVPYTRGAEVSRPVSQVVAEAEAMVRGGTREITLLGQNVNAYHGAGADGADTSLAGLIRRLAKIDGLERIRFTTSHPNDMRDDLYEVYADEPKLMPYLHLPVQSGSDRVLKAMNRKHTAARYLEVIDRLRTVRPDIAISGDFITGFPGESEDDFLQTMALVQEVNYAYAYSFKYSARPGTPAAERTEVPEDEKADRLQRLQALLTAQQTAFQEAQVGRMLPILLEKPGRDEGQLVGKSPYLQAVHMDAPSEMLGQIVNAEITASVRNSLSARLAV